VSNKRVGISGGRRPLSGNSRARHRHAAAADRRPALRLRDRTLRPKGVGAAGSPS